MPAARTSNPEGRIASDARASVRHPEPCWPLAHIDRARWFQLRKHGIVATRECVHRRRVDRPRISALLTFPLRGGCSGVSFCIDQGSCFVLTVV
jgi:hypothetical protein